LASDHLLNRLLLPDHSGGDQREQRGRLLHHSGRGQPVLNLHRTQLGVRSMGRGSECTTHTLNAKRFKGARLRTSVSAYLRKDRAKISKKIKLMSSRWWLQGELTSWSTPGISSPGALMNPTRGLHAWFPPTWGAAPLRLAISTAALHPPMAKGADPPTSVLVGVGP
jgi:hypothetical protein